MTKTAEVNTEYKVLTDIALKDKKGKEFYLEDGDRCVPVKISNNIVSFMMLDKENRYFTLTTTLEQFNNILIPHAKKPVKLSELSKNIYKRYSK